MVLTRAEREARKAALAHVLTEVLALDDDSPIHKAISNGSLQGIDTYGLVNLSFEEIKELTYTDDLGDEKVLPVHYTTLLRVFKSYFIHRRNQGSPIGEKWTDITHQDITDYRVSPDYPLASTSPPSLALTLNTSQGQGAESIWLSPG
jgi:hypothetical protein